MDKLNWYDMNSLNAIAGYLRCIGNHGMAAVLLSIQYKASAMLEEAENGIPKDGKRDKS